jgi:hypothetical protein
VNETGIDPFDADDINRALIPGLVYSSGLGHFRKPHFVLAELKRAEVREGVKVYVAGCEYARDLIAPPAAMRDGAIFLRMDAVRRLLWNKFEEWQWKEQRFGARLRPDWARIERGSTAPRRRARRDDPARVGEARAESLLGRDERSFPLTSRRTLARAVRDHLADCLVTLPTLLEREAVGSLHFYLANLSGLRRALFPALLQAYESWLESRYRPLAQVVPPPKPLAGEGTALTALSSQPGNVGMRDQRAGRRRLSPPGERRPFFASPDYCTTSGPPLGDGSSNCCSDKAAQNG